MYRLLFFFLSVTVLTFCTEQSTQQTTSREKDAQSWTSPLGKEFQLPEPSPAFLEKHETAKKNYLENPDSVENIIWYGRRTAYLGRYQDAIEIYTEGIKKFPDEARLYRHRGHRYISLRKFDLAIQDLEQAAILIKGTENKIEPDGLPNALNIPISTLHGNIWYHLGLAYYLKHEYTKAAYAYEQCRAVGKNDDNLVSSTHWLYMIYQRLGLPDKAKAVLSPIQKDAQIIENHSYHRLCCFYKGILPLDSLQSSGPDSPTSDAVKYGIANWYYYQNQKDSARVHMEQMVTGTSWSSFGYIAAESDLLRYFSK